MKVIKINDKEYPERLRKIKNPPLKLYVKGNIELVKKSSLAVVGTRHITEYGIKNCKNIVREIVKRQIPVISGMASGTDTIAHETALRYNGETIAVLGSGFNHIYPKENVNLFNKIIERNGLIMTEYPPDTGVKSERFLERNRIVSGLSEGIIVIEAAYRSGTSVTARIAYSQGKVVMALPGKLDNSYGVGVNRLIQKGAKLVTDIDDILMNFPQFSDNVWIQEEDQLEIIEIKDEYREIIQLLRKKGTLSIEEILENMKHKNLTEVMNLLINMEIENIVQQELGIGYKLVI